MSDVAAFTANNGQEEEDMDWQETGSTIKNIVSGGGEFIEDSANTSADADEIEEEEAKPRVRGGARHYLKITDYENYTVAKKALDDNDDYFFRYIRESHYDGDKHWYTCANNNKCPKSMYLLLHIYSQKCSLHQADCEHDHGDTDHKSKLPHASRAYV